MGQESEEKVGRLIEDVGNTLTKLDLTHETVRHLFEEHRTINPRLRRTLERTEAEYRAKLRRLIEALDGQKK